MALSLCVFQCKSEAGPSASTENRKQVCVAVFPMVGRKALWPQKYPRKRKEQTSLYILILKHSCCDSNVYNLGLVTGGTEAKIQATRDKL